MNKTISVILPTYNIEKYIHATITSVLEQTYTDIELIIIDDCSSDNTVDIIKEFEANDKRVKFYRNKVNKGPGATRNIGISKATGYYLTFIDHDDYQDSDRYENMIAILEETETDVVLSYATEKNEITGLFKNLPYPKFSKNIIELKKNPKDVIFYFIPPWAKIYKTSLITENNIKFSEKGVMFDDLMFHALLLTKVSKVSVYNKIGYTHFFFPRSITGTHTDAFEFIIDDHMKSFEQTLNYPLNNDTNKNIIVYFFYQLITELIENTPKKSEEILKDKLKDFLSKHHIKTPFNAKLLRRKLIRVKFGQKKNIIKLLGIYLLKNVDPESTSRPKMFGKILLNRWRRLGEIIRLSTTKHNQKITFWVVSAQYNAGEVTLKCLDSVYNQNLPRNRVKHIFIDDASTDNTPELIESWLSKHPDHNVEYIRNEKNMNIAHNLYKAFKRAPKGSISMQLDGDDWLADSKSLSFLTKVYADKNIWTTFNTWRSSDKKILGQTRKFTTKTITNNLFRYAPWNSGHLKTFRSELFQHVPKNYMIDPRTNYWWSSSADQAFFLCILELSGRHIYHTHRILYTYYIRDHTKLNNYSLKQEDCKREIRELTPLKPLESLNTSYT